MDETYFEEELKELEIPEEMFESLMSLLQEAYNYGIEDGYEDGFGDGYDEGYNDASEEYYDYEL
jgi:flagellar biosynthesis/type III secretory pathway protein FliH